MDTRKSVRQRKINLKYKASYVYFLIDPRNNNIKYIGNSTNPGNRYINHSGITRSSILKDDWVGVLRHYGLKPRMIIVATCSNFKEGEQIEKHLIQEMQHVHPLLNIFYVDENRRISRIAKKFKMAAYHYQYSLKSQLS